MRQGTGWHGPIGTGRKENEVELVVSVVVGSDSGLSDRPELKVLARPCTRASTTVQLIRSSPAMEMGPGGRPCAVLIRGKRSGNPLDCTIACSQACHVQVGLEVPLAACCTFARSIVCRKVWRFAANNRQLLVSSPIDLRSHFKLPCCWVQGSTTLITISISSARTKRFK